MPELRFLVIEDDLFYQTYVNDLLAETGVDIVNAADGEAGLALAISEKPDLIITDIEIPKIQGFVLLKNLRENPETRDIPVIMMSGKVEKDLLERHSKLSTHADGYLLKPFSGQNLIDLIRKVLDIELQSGAEDQGETALEDVSAEEGVHGTAAAGPMADPHPAHDVAVDGSGPGGAPPEGGPFPKSVPGDAAGPLVALVVDDSKYILDIANDFLKEIGAEVSTASDGESGFKLAVEKIPDVILLDVQMPGLNGFVVCEKLKKEPSTAEIPVVLMSAVVDDESFQRHSRLRYHADAYLQKPFMKSELQELVTSITYGKASRHRSIQGKTGFLIPSEEELNAAQAERPEKAGAEQMKLVEELKKAREIIEASKAREEQLSAEMEGVRRERDGFEEQLYSMRGSVDSREKEINDKLTMTSRRYEESRQEVERLNKEVGSLKSRLEEKSADTGTADELKVLEKQAAEFRNSLDLSMSENEQLRSQLAAAGDMAGKLKAAENEASQYRHSLDLAKSEIEQLRARIVDTREVDGLKGQVAELTSEVESASARADELAALNDQLKQEAQDRAVDEEMARSLQEAIERAEKAEKGKRSLERDLAAAVAAKNEIEEQVKTLLTDTRAAGGEVSDPGEMESLRKENRELAIRVSEAESKTKWLGEVEKQLETVQKEADGLRHELESMSLDGVAGRDENAELVTLREKLDKTLKRVEELEAERGEAADSLPVVEEMRAERDELSKKAADLEKQLDESRELAAEEASSKRELEARLEELIQSKELMEADLEEARKLMDKADGNEELLSTLQAEMAAGKKLRASLEKQVRELRSAAAEKASDSGASRELEAARRELAKELAEVRNERDELAGTVAELTAAMSKDGEQTAGSSGSTDGRLDHLEEILSKTVSEAQAALMEQRGREVALEESVESLMRSLEEERAFFRQEREKWREREDELKDAFEDALRESRRIMGEEAARLYPMHIPRQARPLEVVTGMKKYGVAAGLAVAAVVLFLSGHFLLSDTPPSPGSSTVPAGVQPVKPAAPDPEPQASSRPPMPFLATSGPGDSYEELWRRNTVQSVSEDMMLQATFHTRQELEAAIRYAASKEGWTNERVTKAMGDLARTYDLEGSYYVTVFSKNLRGGYPGYAENFERHIALRDDRGHETRAVLPAQLERSKFITSRVSAAGKEMNPVFLYEVGLTVAFSRKEFGSSPGGLQLVLYDVGAVPMRVLTWDMDIVSTLHPVNGDVPKRRNA